MPPRLDAGGAGTSDDGHPSGTRPATMIGTRSKCVPSTASRICSRMVRLSAASSLTRALPVAPAVQTLRRVLHGVGVRVLDFVRNVDPSIECITVLVDGLLARVLGRRVKRVATELPVSGVAEE